jgi:WD40 repeat protein/tRNA A-37 threonylcarbamoyl transferase component Bud32
LIDLATLAPSAESPTAEEDLRELPTVSARNYTAFRELAGGKGGMGCTEVARDRRLGRDVAIKRITYPSRKDPTLAAALRRRFENEAKLTARLEHPAIVAVHEAGRFDDGEPFYAMPLVRGEPLTHEIERCRSVEARLALLPRMTTVCEAIAFAHTKGIVHRDIKPQNILVGSFGETVLIDWGLARDLSEVSRETTGEGIYREVVGDGLTQFGAGTPEYMSPEQASGEPATPAMDVYSLGASMYHVLAGEPPYASRRDGDARLQLHAGPPRPLADVVPGISRELVDIVERAMAREPEKRFTSALELAEELRRFQTGQLLRSRHYSTGEIVRHWLRRHRVLVRAAVATLVIVAVVGAVSIRRIVSERRRAESGARAAEAAASRLRLVQAQRSLETDPTESLAWLKTLDRESQESRMVRLVAADAESRGVATEVLRPFAGKLATPRLSHAGRYLAASDNDGTVWLWDRQTKNGRLLRGHTDAIYELRFSSDDQLLASAGEDGTLRLWRPHSGEAVLAHKHDSGIGWLTMSPDGATVAFSNDDEVVLLNIGDGEARLLDRQPGSVFLIEFSPRGDLLLETVVRKSPAYTPALGEREMAWEILLWDPATHSSRKLNKEPLGRVMGAEFSPDGELVAAVSDDRLRVWNARSGELMQTIPFVGPRWIRFSPDGNHVAVSSGVSGVVRVWNLETWLHQDLVGKSFVNHIAFSPDGSQLAASGQDGTIQIWDVETGASRTLVGQGPGGWSWAAFSPDGDLVSAGDHTMRVWDLKLPRDRVLHAVPDVQPQKGSQNYVNKLVAAVAISPDGASVASGGVDGVVRISRVGVTEAPHLVSTGKPISDLDFSADGKMLAIARPSMGVELWDREANTFRQFETAVDAQVVAFSPQGSMLAASGARTTSVWDVVTRQLVGTISHRSRVVSLTFSGDGHILVVAARADAEVVVWDVVSGRRQALPTGRESVSAAAIAPDGSQIAVAFGFLVRVFDLPSGAHRDLEGPKESALQVAFSPTDPLLASATQDGHVFVWDLESGQRRSFSPSSNFLSSIAFSPDGSRLVAAGPDVQVHVCELHADECRHLRGHSDGVSQVQFSPDGRFIASASRDGSVRLWYDDLPFDPGSLRSWLRRRTTLAIENDRAPIR